MFPSKQRYALIFMHLCMCNHVWEKQGMETTVRLNRDLDSGVCFKSVLQTSYSDCFRRFESGKISFNVMVYRRHYLLCKLCFVSKTLTIKKEPGFILVHYPITDTSQENLAFKKPTQQSSIYFESNVGNAPSSLAVDGIRASDMIIDDHFACAHTADQSAEEYWWRVDLEHVYPVSKVAILNRKEECCSHCLHKLIITVGETENSMHLCAEYEGPVGPGKSQDIFCQKPMLGRFVRISKAIQETVVLCEVEVYH
ncbi:fucolectin-like [Mercenaria mercenaria]|uniref:fucolectin-like n=1 Tax=Mercenaria mercenaria TaxID=6596 RepID=UPI00234F4FF8|nr:fucolectin-like [Mercenaria mercenaria]